MASEETTRGFYIGGIRSIAARYSNHVPSKEELQQLSTEELSARANEYMKLRDREETPRKRGMEMERQLRSLKADLSDVHITQAEYDRLVALAEYGEQHEEEEALKELQEQYGS